MTTKQTNEQQATGEKRYGTTAMHKELLALRQAHAELQKKHTDLQRAFEAVSDNVPMLDAELKYVTESRNATQEILNGLLSSDCDGKHSHAANAVRVAQSAMLERMGWLNHEQARMVVSALRGLVVAVEERGAAEGANQKCIFCHGVEDADVCPLATARAALVALLRHG